MGAMTERPSEGAEDPEGTDELQEEMVESDVESTKITSR